MSGRSAAHDIDTHTDKLRDVTRRMAAAAGAESQFVTLRSGARLHVLLAGDGPPVVHLHGTTTSSLSHLMLAGHMPASRSVFIDRPGHGLSDPSDVATSSYPDFAVSVVEEVLDLLGLDRPVVVGASAGGAWATWFALARPDRVEALATLGATPTYPEATAPLPLRLMATPGVGALLRLKKPDRRMLLRILTTVGEGPASFADHPDLLDSLVAIAHDPVSEATNSAELRALLTLRGVRPEIRLSADDLARLEVPTLLVVGDHDPVGSVAEARVAAAAIPDCRVEVLPTGHVPQLTQAPRVAELLAELHLPR